MSHTHTVIDDDKHFQINVTTRMIERTTDVDPTLIQGDHNSERVTFDIPTFVDGHDMRKCDKAQVHFINVSKDDPNIFSASIYETDDLHISEDTSTLSFSWLIDRSATKYIGPLNFAVRFACTTVETDAESGNIITVPVYAWNTKPYMGVVVSEGIDNNEPLADEYYDIVDQWYATISNAGAAREAEVLQTIDDAKVRVINSIEQAELKGVTTIQNTETELVNRVDEHIEELVKNIDKADIASSLTNKMTELQGEVSKLNTGSFLKSYKPGELCGSPISDTIDAAFCDQYVNNSEYYDHSVNYYLAGNETCLIEHEVGLEPSDIYIVIPVTEYGHKAEYDNTGELHNVYTILKTSFVSMKLLGADSYDSETEKGIISRSYWDVSKGDWESVSNMYDRYPHVPPLMIGPVQAEFDTAYSIEVGDDMLVPLRMFVTFRMGGTSYRYQYYNLSTVTATVMGSPEFKLEGAYLVISPRRHDDSTKFLDLKVCGLNFDDAGTAFTLQPNSITAITGPETEGCEDKYTIILDDGTTKDFKVPNGNAVGVPTFISGSSIHAENVIGAEHIVNATITRKNLIPYPYVSSSSTVRGIAYTINADGSITAKGTVDTGVFSSFYISSTSPALEAGKTYYIGPTSGLLLAYKNADGETKYLSNTSFTWLEEYTFVQLYIQYSPGVTVNETVYPMLCVDDGTSRDYVPPIDDLSAVTITRCGKNLIPYPHAYSTGVIEGVTYMDNGDGTITATGTCTGTDNSIHFLNLSTTSFLHLAPGTYTLSGCPAGGAYETYRISIKSSDASPEYWHDYGKGCTFTLTSDKYVTVYICIIPGTTVDGLVFKPQIEAASTASDYEQYSGTEYGVDSDGVISTPIKSISPIMNLISNKAGVIIDATYQRNPIGGTAITVNGNVVPTFNADTKVSKVEPPSIGQDYVYLTYTPATFLPTYNGIRPATDEAKPNTIVRRSTDGTFSAATPTAPENVTTKKYVDERVDKLDKLTGKMGTRLDFLEGMTLSYIEDSTEAYEKTIPEGVEPKAILNSFETGVGVLGENALDPSIFEERYPQQKLADGSTNAHCAVAGGGKLQIYIPSVDGDKVNEFIFEAPIISAVDANYVTYTLDGQHDGWNVSMELYTPYGTEHIYLRITITNNELPDLGDYVAEFNANLSIMVSDKQNAEFKAYTSDITHVPVTHLCGRYWGPISEKYFWEEKFYTVPSGIRSLPDYGKPFAELNFDDKAFVSRNKRVVFTGTENWVYGSRTANYYVDGELNTATIDSGVCLYDKTIFGSEPKNDGRYVCSHSEYTNDEYNVGPGYATSTSPAHKIFMRNSSGTTGVYWASILEDLGFENSSEGVANFKTWLAKRYESGNPVILEYETDEATITDISEYLTDYTGFKVIDIYSYTEKAGEMVFDKIRFTNEAELPVKSTITYVKAKE